MQPSLRTTVLRHMPTQLSIAKGDALHTVDFCFPSPAQWFANLSIYWNSWEGWFKQIRGLIHGVLIL